MDPRWVIKKDEWSGEEANAIRFFDELRILFAADELIRSFPVVLEYYLRSDIRGRISGSALRSTRADFHIETIVNYLQTSPQGIFVIERHLPPDLGADRLILLHALDVARGEPG